ncbi:MAG: potassium channel family protein [Candidatus Methanospirareceae archaeon]
MSEDLRMEIRAMNAKKVLTQMKDISESMLDLAYSAIFHSNKEIVREVLRLEEEMDSLLYKARIAIMLGARSLEDAIKFSGVLQIASAAEKISNAAGDIAKTALGIDIAYYLDMEDFEEVAINAKITPMSVLKDKTLGELKLEAKTGMRISGIKRGTRWICCPKKDEKLLEGDIIVATGPPEGIPIFYKMATGEEYKQKEMPDKKIMEEIVDVITEMKNLSELMVGLSYFAILFFNKDIAREVKDLEERMDAMKEKLELLVMEAATRISDKELFDELKGFLHIATSSEIISDAAYEIADVVLRDIELHPVVLASIMEADEIVAKVEVKNEKVIGKTLDEMEMEKIGMFVLAIRKKDGNWIYNPPPEMKIEKGDLLIVKGPKEGNEVLKGVCG